MIMTEALSYQVIGALFYICGAIYSKEGTITSTIFTLMGGFYFIISFIVIYIG